MFFGKLCRLDADAELRVEGARLVGKHLIQFPIHLSQRIAVHPPFLFLRNIARHSEHLRKMKSIDVMQSRRNVNVSNIELCEVARKGLPVAVHRGGHQDNLGVGLSGSGLNRKGIPSNHCDAREFASLR